MHSGEVFDGSGNKNRPNVGEYKLLRWKNVADIHTFLPAVTFLIEGMSFSPPVLTTMTNGSLHPSFEGRGRPWQLLRA